MLEMWNLHTVNFLHSLCWVIAHSFYILKCTGFQVMQSKILEVPVYSGRHKGSLEVVFSESALHTWWTDWVCPSSLLEDMMMDSSLWFTNMALTKYGLRGKLKEQEMLYSHSRAMGVEEVLSQTTTQPPLLPCSTILPKLELWKWSWTTRSHGDLLINCTNSVQALHKCRWPDSRLGKEITWPHVFWWHVASSPWLEMGKQLTCPLWLCQSGECCLYLYLGAFRKPTVSYNTCRATRLALWSNEKDTKRSNSKCKAMLNNDGSPLRAGTAANQFGKPDYSISGPTRC